MDVQGLTARVRALQFRDGSLSQVYQRRLSRANLIVTAAPVAGPRGYLRVGLWGQVKNEEYIRVADTLLVTPDTLTGAVALHLRWLRPQFAVATHYNGFAQEEDVDLSTSVLAGTWVAPTAFGYPRTGFGPYGELQVGVPLGRSFARFWVRANGLFTGTGLDSGRVQGAVTFVARVIPRNATIFRVDGARLKGQAPGSEIDLGHGAGPRAFGPHAFTGTRAMWGTVEHRWFLIDELFGVIGVGVAAFLDYGGAWYVDQPRRLGGDVGIGLRLGPTRATGTGLGRFDLAYRFGDGANGGGVVFSVGRSINY
jgi:hypothetical protein